MQLLGQPAGPVRRPLLDLTEPAALAEVGAALRESGLADALGVTVELAEAAT
jgi:hypothetical protein